MIMFEPHVWRIARMAIRRVFRQQPSPEDAELDKWEDQNPRHRALLEDYPDPGILIRDAIQFGETDIAAAWEQLTDMDPTLKVISTVEPNPDTAAGKVVHRLPWYRSWKAAVWLLALLVLTVLARSLFVRIGPKSEHTITIAPSRPRIYDPGNVLDSFKPGSYKLYIVLPGVDTINVSALPEKDTAIYRKIVVRRAGLGTLVFRTFPSSGRHSVKIGLVTPRGGWYTVVLPDQSRISLNAGSTLQLSTSFGHPERSLILRGEAYIQAAGQANDPPLHIRIDGSKPVTHLLAPGAVCNISAYSDELESAPFIRTTVIKGIVRIADSSGSAMSNVQTGGRYTLYDHMAPDVHQADTISAIAWKNGRFIFDARPIAEIMPQLSRWYDARVRCIDPPDTPFTLRAPRSQAFRDVLGILDRIGCFQVDVKTDTIIISPLKTHSPM